MFSIASSTSRAALFKLSTTRLRSTPTTMIQDLSPKASLSRYFSTSAQEAYWNEKKELKRIRTERFAERLAHKEVVKKRRDGKPKNVKKKIFDAWFLPKIKYELLANRKCKRLGMEWKTQVAVVLERLPVVLPDKPQWEKDYDNLRDYLDQFGIDYPPELFGKQEIETLEDLSDETYFGKVFGVGDDMCF
jgi:39S mitochondrial ribosomal protein L46